VVKANYVCRILRHRNKRERVGEDWMMDGGGGGAFICRLCQ
jgi:hypothetical protein